MKFIPDWSTPGHAAALLLMGALAVWSYRAIDQQVQTAQCVEHSQDVIDHLQAVLVEVERAPADVRGFLLTRDPGYRKALLQIQNDAPRQIDAFAQLTAENPARRNDVPQLKQAVVTYLSALQREVDQFNAYPVAGPDLNRTRTLQAAVEDRVRAIRSDERHLLAQRLQQDQVVSGHAETLIDVCSGSALLLVLVSFVLSAHATGARRQAEEVLRESEQRFRFMVSSIEDYAVFMLDAGGNVISWNSGAEQIKGFRAEQVIGKHFSCFFPKDDVRAGVPERSLTETAALGHFEDEGLRLRADGTTFLASVKMNAVRNEQGRLLGFVKVARDITETREKELRIQQLNEALEQRASELELSNRELEAFGYSVSHDLRAPLRHIAGFVEILQKSPIMQSDPECWHYLGIIAKAEHQMGLLIDGLLSLSRTTRLEMRLAQTDMGALVAEVIEEQEHELKGRKVTWNIHPLDPIQGDPHLLRLVWTNLISNALKYTRTRKCAEIEIGQEAHSSSEDAVGGETVYYVRDNGVGFNMEHASKLFGVFQRLHRAEDFEGTGIGLANVQRIIHRHGGRVWAESKPQQGAIFNFSLPKCRKDNKSLLCCS
jgi:PAS domain S-box-containing protein